MPKGYNYSVQMGEIMTTGTTTVASSADYSNAGGVAARQGFRYQDHVAVSFLIDMIGDETLLEVHCETHDDIVLVWRDGAGPRYEYVQVKTTEDDKKYSKTEIYERDNKKEKTSLIEKSLLCDKGHCSNPIFRIVSRRDVANSLTPLTIPINQRATLPTFSPLQEAISKKYKTTSDGGKNLSYWTANVLWNVAGAQEAIISTSHSKIGRLADSEGANPPWQLVTDGYQELLIQADSAALASKLHEPNKKIISRANIRKWWNNFLTKTKSYHHRNAKPYDSNIDKFLVEFIDLEEEIIKRHLVGFEAQFEETRWRTQELADHLLDCLPEVTLKASELAQIAPSRMRQKVKTAVDRVSHLNHTITLSQLLGDTLLHIALRQKFGSEPIACRVFEKGLDGHTTFSNAHIIRRENDELWLGKSRLATDIEYKQIINSMLTELSEHIKTTFLRKETEIIIALREPMHLRYNGIDGLLTRSTPISELLKSTWFCLLIAYDSDVISTGCEGYRERILSEANIRYEELKEQMKLNLETSKIAIFLVPLDSVELLLTEFNNLLKHP